MIAYYIAQMSHVVRMCSYSNIQMSQVVKCVRHTNDRTTECALVVIYKRATTYQFPFFFLFFFFFFLKDKAKGLLS